MNLLKKLKVKAKIISAFMVVALLICIIGIVGTTALKMIASSSDNMYEYNLKTVYMLSDFNENLTTIKADTLKLIYQHNESEIAALKKDIQINIETNDKYVQIYSSQLRTASDKESWKAFEDKLKEYIKENDEIILMVDAYKYEDANKEVNSKLTPISDSMFSTLSKIIDENLAIAQKSATNNDVIYKTCNIIMLLIIVLGIATAVAFGTILSSSINRSLKKMVSLAKDFADYDFSNNYEVSSGDEFGITYEELIKSQANIKELIKVIILDSQEMSAASEELSATAEELASKTETINTAVKSIAYAMLETSASSEQISASIDEVDSSINVLSDKAIEGSNNASKSKERATKAQKNGHSSIEETQKLSKEKEDKILKAIEDGKIVNKIKDMANIIGNIAEQTNLLALNASIEAARAGEHGRGFTVVAQEVAKLADQSSKSVTEIQTNIIKVQEAFKNLSDNSYEVLDFIQNNVKLQFETFEDTGNKYYNDSEAVSKMSEEIASMSEELNVTVNQVSEAVQELSSTAQNSSENAEIIKESMDETKKSVELITMTAQSQAELAQKLNEMVMKFKI